MNISYALKRKALRLYGNTPYARRWLTFLADWLEKHFGEGE